MAIFSQVLHLVATKSNLQPSRNTDLWHVVVVVVIVVVPVVVAVFVVVVAAAVDVGIVVVVAVEIDPWCLGSPLYTLCPQFLRKHARLLRRDGRCRKDTFFAAFVPKASLARTLHRSSSDLPMAF